ncbi:tetratricopeptide repeat protein [Streptomyces sp. TUS-ST3]|uniref:tetratricopeptide repeat protein n=1 Tax=Streptomyces sp. TUS-ST3 TaxID=3025591 RepID=UPI0024E08CD4|nr:tetratricopeptide repeat protein [Streptomyces sp. TUS-ST3]
MRLFRSRGRDHDVRRVRPALVPAVLRLRAGQYAEAEAAARAVAADRPADAPLALAVAALSAGAQGRHAEALAEYDALLPVFGRDFGAEHPQTLLLRSNRAQTLIALGRHAECEAECAAVARAADRVRGPERPRMTAAARNGQIYAVNAQGRHPEAERLAREALDAHRTADRFTLALRLGLARSLNGQARHEEALAEAERAGKLSRRLPEEQRRVETGAVELAMAGALLGLGRGTEARSRAVVAHDACVAAFGPGHYRTAEARALLDRIGGA